MSLGTWVILGLTILFFIGLVWYGWEVGTISCDDSIDTDEDDDCE